MLSNRDIEVLNGWQHVADRWRSVADNIQRQIDFAFNMRTMQGIQDMPEYAFNATQFDPQYSGGGGLPEGKHPVIISASKLAPTKDNTGGMMVFTLTAIDGPAKGSTMDDRLNLHNKSPQAVEIANKQLAAYCAVIGVHSFQRTEELHDKPFIVEVAKQTSNPNFVEIRNIFDINGNEPGKSAGGAQQQQSQGGGNQWGGNAAGGGGGAAWGGGQQQPQDQSQGGGAPAGGGGGGAGPWGGAGGGGAAGGGGKPAWGG